MLSGEREPCGDTGSGSAENTVDEKWVDIGNGSLYADFHIISLALCHHLHDDPERNRECAVDGGSFSDTCPVRVYTVWSGACDFYLSGQCRSVKEEDACIFSKIPLS